MKLFKRIYYPVVCVLMLVMLVFSILNATGGYKKTELSISDAMTIIEKVGAAPHSVDDKAKKTVRDYIADTLESYGIHKAEGDKDVAGYNTADYAVTTQGQAQPTFVVQEAELKFDDVRDFYNKHNLGTPVVRNYKVDNIIVSIPAKTTTAKKRTADTLLFISHYDSFGETAGATETGLHTANMLLNIKAALTEEFENDLVFVFADYGNENNLGAYAFRNYFKGFNDLALDVTMVVSLDTMGTGGTLTLYNTNNTDFDFVKSFAKVNNSTYVNSMFSTVYKDTFTAASVFPDKITVSFANIGQGENYLTRNDTVSNVSKTVLAQSMDITYKMIREYGNISLDAVRTDTEGVYFSYLNIMTVAFPSWVAMMFSGIMLLLIGAVIGLNFKFKNMSFKSTAIGAAVSLIGIIGAIVGIFAVYYIVGAIVAGFGIISFQGVPYITFSNAGLVIGAMILASACAIACYTFFKWLFKIKARDVVNGNVLLVALAAVVLGFAVPKISVLFSVLAIFELITMLAVNIFRDKFKARFGMDMDRLFLPLLGMLLSMPVVITGLFVLSSIYGAVMYPLFIGLFPLFIGMIAPYFSFLNPVFQKIADRLPERKLRKFEYVTEEVPNPAKKGRMIEQTVKRKFEEKVPRKYTSAFGLTIIAAVSVLVLIFSGVFGSNISKNLTYAHGEIDAVYDDTLVYSVSATFSGSYSANSGEWIIKDRDAYSRLSFNGITYDKDNKQYSMENNENLSRVSKPNLTTSTSGTTKTVVINPAYGGGRFTIRLTGASSVKKIKVSVTETEESYEKTFTSQSIIIIASSGRTTLTIEGSSLYSGTAEYVETARGQSIFTSFTDTIKDYIDNKNVAVRIECSANI